VVYDSDRPGSPERRGRGRPAGAPGGVFNGTRFRVRVSRGHIRVAPSARAAARRAPRAARRASLVFPGHRPEPPARLAARGADAPQRPHRRAQVGPPSSRARKRACALAQACARERTGDRARESARARNRDHARAHVRAHEQAGWRKPALSAPARLHAHTPSAHARTPRHGRGAVTRINFTELSLCRPTPKPAPCNYGRLLIRSSCWRVGPRASA
jgi:hypothetical protein